MKIKQEADSYGDEIEQAQAQPRQPIFDVLKDYALGRGLLFYCRPDGTLVFGRPVNSGKALFNIVRRRDGKGNNVISSTRSRDISARYSKVTLIGQRQGGEEREPEDISQTGSAIDPDFPFPKPFVQEAGSDVSALDKQAKLLMDKQKTESERLSCTVPGHSQNGSNWQVNARAHVLDEKRDIDEDMTITGRVFKRSKNEGTTTEIRVSRIRR